MPSSSSSDSTCLPLAELDAALANRARAESLQGHLQRCARCRKRADHILENDVVASLLRRSQLTKLKHDPPAEPMAEMPPSLPGLELGREVGRGGQGIVYEAEQTATKRRVAVKMLRPRAFRSASQTLRFETEIQLAASLRHPNLVTVHDSGKTQAGQHYFVMELIEGRSPHEALVGCSLREKLEVFLKLCDGITHAHQRGVIHRDLKPGNVLISEDMEPHILDFGLAKDLDPATEPITAGPHFLGTVFYAAPEQLSGKPEDTDVRTDVYALGHLLYEMLTGEHPYPLKGSLSEVVQRITRLPASDPREHSGEIDEDLSVVVLKALAKDKDERYPSASALADDVRRYLAGEAVEAKQGQRWYVIRKTLRRYRLAVSIVMAVLLVVGTLSILLAERTFELQREKEELGRTLEDMHFEAARAHIAAGNMPAAETLLWNEYLRSRTERSRWLLRELYAQSPCLATWKASHDELRELLFGARDELLVLRSDDGLHLWNLEPRCHRASLPEDVRVRSVALDAGSQRLLVGTAEGVLSTWSLHGEAQEEHVAHTGGLLSIIVQGARNELFTGGSDGRVQRWKLDSLEPLEAWTAHEDIVCIAIHPGGRLLSTSGGSDRKLRVWDLATHPPTLLGEATTHGGRHFWNEDGTLVVTNGGSDPEGCLFHWDEPERSLRPAGTLPGFWTRLRLANGRVGQVGAAVGAIQIGWDMGAFVAEENLVASSNPRSVAVNAVGDLIAASYPDGVVRLWEVGGARSPRRLMGHRDSVHSVRFSPDGALLASGADSRGSGEPTLRLWKLPEAEEIAAAKAHRAVVSGVDFSADGRSLATSGHDGTIGLWSVPALAPLATLEGHEDHVSGVRFLPPASTHLVSAGSDRRLHYWNVAKRAADRSSMTEHPIRISSFDVANNGASIATGQGQGVSSGAVLLHEERTAHWLEDPERAMGSIRAIAYGADDSWVAAGSDDRSIRIWQLPARRLIQRLEGHRDKVFALATHPAGELLASADSSGEIRIWSTSSWDCLSVLEATELGTQQHQLVFALAFHPERELLASGGSNGELLLWDLTYFDRHIEGNREHQELVRKP